MGAPEPQEEGHLTAVTFRSSQRMLDLITGTITPFKSLGMTLG